MISSAFLILYEYTTKFNSTIIDQDSNEKFVNFVKNESLLRNLESNFKI